MSILMLLVLDEFLPSRFTCSTFRTCRSRQRRFASGTGIDTRSRRLTATPERFSGDDLPFHFSFHRRTPISQRARACRAVVLPELLGPIRTTALPSSTSMSSQRLKLRILRRVSMPFDLAVLEARHRLDGSDLYQTG